MKNKKNIKIQKDQTGNALLDIYKNEEGYMPDMSKLDHTKKGFFKKALFVIITLLIISLTAWAGYVFFTGKSGFSSKKVLMNIKAPFNIISGENIEYDIFIENNEEVDLSNVELFVKLPNGFIFKDANYNLKQNENFLENAVQNTYFTKLPKIPTNSNLEIIIKGQMVGEIEYLPTISANLKYSPGDLSSEYEVNASFDSEISDSLIQLTTEYKNQLVTESLANINFTIKNLNKVSPIENLKVVIEFSDKFKDKVILKLANNNYNKVIGEVTEIKKTNDYIELEPLNKDRFKSDNEFLIDGISPNDSLKFKLNGKFNVEENAKENIIIKIYTKDAQNDYNLQTQETMEFQIVNGEMLNTLIINGSDQNQAINFGDTVTYLLTLQNKSKSALSNVSVRSIIESDIINQTTLIDEKKGIINKNQILWTDEQIPKLALLLPEDEIEIEISFKTKDYESIKKINPEKYKITSYFETTINQIDGVDVSKISSSNTIINYFNTNLKFNAKGVYFAENGDTLGSGPIPPTIDQKTTYQINFKVDNSIHELKDIVISATLPENVTWEYNTNVDAGNIIYNNQTITWNINRVPISVQTVNGLFNISIIPKITDVNKVLTLLKDIKIEAIDSQTNNKILIENPPITTNIEDDPSGLVKSSVE